MEINNYPNYLIYPDGKIEKIKGLKKGVMKTNINTHGYLRLGLRNDEGQKNLKIHRLLAQHYIPNPNNFPQVDHKDRNPLNNSLDNLRWCDSSTNCMNRNIFKNNTSGFKNIYQRKGNGSWFIQYNRFKIKKTFKTKKEALCFKYICQLRIKAGHFTAEFQHHQI